MSLEELLAEGLMDEFVPTEQLVKQTLGSSEKDLKASKAVLQTGNFDWALAIAYNSMLQAGRALMFHSGFRPKGEYKHLAVVRFASEKLRGAGSDLIRLFNKARKRRHMIVYEAEESVSKSEAEAVISSAEQFLAAIKKAISQK